MQIANLSGRKVFITGADGFIGSHLTEMCVRAGADVTALSCYSSFDSDGWLDDLPADVRAALRVVRGDIRDGDQMRGEIRGQEVVFHLAALIAIPFSYHAPSTYVQTNVQGTVNVLMAAREAGCARVVHTSTSETYGTAQVRPIPESHPLVGQSPYSASKIAADKMAESMFLSFGVPVVTLRPFNTYGPRQSQRAVIPTVIRQAVDPACADIRVGELSPERDWTYVEDTARAFLCAAGAGAEPGQVYNAGTGHTVTVGSMVEDVLSLTGCGKAVVCEQERVRPANSEVRALQADFSRFQAATGWHPTTSLRDGLAKTIDWWRGRPLAQMSRGYRI